MQANEEQMECDGKHFSKKKYFATRLQMKYLLQPADFCLLEFSTLLIQELISAGKRIAAAQKLYFENSQIEIVCTYFEGYLIGYYHEYYESGQLKSEYFFLPDSSTQNNVISIESSIGSFYNTPTYYIEYQFICSYLIIVFYIFYIKIY